MTIPNLFSLIGTSWDFFRKQPVLNGVLLWFIALPMMAMTLIDMATEAFPVFQDITNRGVILGETDFRPLLAYIVIEILLSLVMLWGIACILLVGKRLTVNRAGRTRSSLKTVRKEAVAFILPLLLTSILRSCFTFLWALLFIVPGVIYYIRTMFYHVALVCEGHPYRSALQRSSQIVRGATWKALGAMLGLSVVLFFPVIMIASILDTIAQRLDPRLLVATAVIDSGLFAIVLVLFTISMILLYNELKKTSPSA
ncbi:hypothetical protein COU80_05170 [Candidatus Peregrinibacteria bacterium CG10_big_fil_rev_8_21_14_0_10_55_24]|nr:MAG: hypothetical protein COU80_05170 [Candidatus Peregrinibacteria bacterium CG10_big_fil_rev_8_21_14_0_10_55_24]